MKIALITDTHWGVRNDNVSFHDNSKKFLDDVFFPTLMSKGINHVIHLGDIVDRRKYINFLTAKRMREDFLYPLENMGITLDIIAGNHDVYYKNTNEVNALRELIDGRYYNINIYTEATTVTQKDGTPILYVPWINDENRAGTLKEIHDTKSQIVLGHLELAGFHMYKGSTESHGDDPDLFGRFDTVCSGHYHHKSSIGNIHYLGSHCQFTWSDHGDPRGFHILDTETKELEFVANPYDMFAKIWYDDTTPGKEPENYDFKVAKDKFVKVIVSNKTDLYRFDKFIERIEQHGVIDLQVVEDHLNLNLEGDEDIVNEAESTVEIFKKYIDQIDVGINKKKLESTIVSLYNEALTVQ
ncbi:endonuclease subunit [uncultured Caudovirales phage]|uniref:Endonuclease subunit n=1 Tax=uncultured Caudovirales phage TaxID=2100421 RepID=A0A6J5QRI9_9CAUD|nr:endonuclease subunit [uncultured Caudovirales phage]